ncbi:MAG: DEAD/DEAH box helicase [Nitrospinae bacterium]|nr:DEAD/DEAH box helicase [Nitrospinota bacterium]
MTINESIKTTNVKFSDLGLIEPLLRALRDEKYEHPTPIQAQAIPHLIADRDLLGCAQTGTGKTAAFALPMLQKLANSPKAPKRGTPRALILTPTRELADQIGRSFMSYGRHLRVSHTVVYGGVSMGPQARALSRGVDILVATPGRLMDHMRQKLVFLDKLEVFVLDEADRMLDMGFVTDVKKIIAFLPKQRQTLFFSATMPTAAAQLSAALLTDPVQVKVNPTSSTAEKVEQRVMFVRRENKEALLLSLLQDSAINKALIFTRTKHRANHLAEKLNKSMVRAEAIHGNKSQGARNQALRNFSMGKSRVLVATDVASRGIDIKDISHVINFEMPNDTESYVHRIGRTARAGTSGIALSFCDGEERSILRDIERTIRTQITVDAEHPFHVAHTGHAAPHKPKGFGGGGGGGNFPRRNNFRPRGRNDRFGGRPTERSAS